MIRRLLKSFSTHNIRPDSVELRPDPKSITAKLIKKNQYIIVAKIS